MKIPSFELLGHRGWVLVALGVRGVPKSRYPWVQQFHGLVSRQTAVGRHERSTPEAPKFTTSKLEGPKPFRSMLSPASESPLKDAPHGGLRLLRRSAFREVHAGSLACWSSGFTGFGFSRTLINIQH